MSLYCFLFAQLEHFSFFLYQHISLKYVDIGKMYIFLIKIYSNTSLSTSALSTSSINNLQEKKHGKESNLVNTIENQR